MQEFKQVVVMKSLCGQPYHHLILEIVMQEFKQVVVMKSLCGQPYHHLILEIVMQEFKQVLVAVDLLVKYSVGQYSVITMHQYKEMKDAYS
jgi:hypothetical protein